MVGNLGLIRILVMIALTLYCNLMNACAKYSFFFWVIVV